MDWSTFKPIETTQSERDFDGFSDWDQFTPIQPKPDQGDFTRGIKESFQQLPQLGYGLVAGVGAAAESAFGEGGIATGIKKAGVKGYEEWGAKIAKDAKPSDSWDYSYDQAKQGNFGALVDWLQHGIGYVGGQALQTLATGGIGAVGGKFVAGTAAKQIAEGMVAKEAANIASTEAAKTLTTEAIAKLATANVASKFATLGQSVALGANAVGMEGGEVFGGLVSENKDRALTGSELGKAFAASLGAGALEFVGDKVGLDIMLGKSKLLKPAEFMTGKTGRLARGAIAAAGAAPIEAGTEYAQTLAEEYGKGKDPFSPESFAQARDAAALGALGGTVIGGAGGGMRGATPIAEKPPAVAADPVQPILAAGSVDDAIKAAQAAGQAWQSIAPSQPSEDVAMQRQLAQAAENLAERERIVSEREGAARSAARDARLLDVGQQWQALGITNPQDDLQAQRAGMRPTQDGPTVELQSTAARAIPDRSDITTTSMDDGAGVGVRFGVDDGRLAAGGVDQLGELPTGPVATNELTFPFTKNESGTVLVTGDPAQIRSAFPGLAGVTKFENGKQVGVLFGKSAAPTVIAKLEPTSVKDNTQGTNASAREAAEAGQQQRDAEKKAAEQAARASAAPEGLSVGAMPNSAEPITVKNGVVYIGKYPAQNFDSAENVTVPVGATAQQIVAALKDAGAIGNKQRIFGLPKGESTTSEVLPRAGSADVQAIGVDERLIPVSKRKPKGGRNLRASAYDRNPLLTFLATHGLYHSKGAKDSHKSEFSPDKQIMVMGYGPVFKKTGKRLDVLTNNAIEEGYLPKDGTESQLRELVRRAIAGEKISPLYAQGIAEQIAEQSYAEHLAQQQEAAQNEDFDDPFAPMLDGDFVADDFAVPGYDEASDPIKLEVNALLALADDAGINEDALDSIKEDAHYATLDQSEQAYYEAYRDAIKAAIAASGRDSSADTGETGNAQGQGSQEGLTLTSPSRQDVIAQQERAEQTEKDKLEADAAAEKKAKAEREQKEIAQRQAASAENFQLGQTAEDSLSGQASIFDAPAEQQPKATSDRFAIGKSLTREQRKAVLETLVDVYKAKGAPREIKGQGRDGNERSGYVHSPELFEKSDITGAMVRYYVTLPDGRIAHPSEIFPDYTQNDINNEIERRANAEKRNREIARSQYLADTFDTKRDAAVFWNDLSDKSIKTASGKPTVYDALDRTHITNGNKFAMIPTDVLKNQDMMDAIKTEGWFVVKTDQVEEAKSALDAANVTGKERLDVIKDLRAGALTAQEVKDAYPIGEQKAHSIASNLERHESIMAAVREGTATPEQFKASFESVVANKDAIKAELMAKTKAELLRIGGPYVRMRLANENKADIVSAVYRGMLEDYVLGEGFSYGMEKDSHLNSIRRLVNETDADKLAQYVKDRKAAMEEYAAQRAAKAAAMENPQTLDDYRALMRQHVSEGKTSKEAFLMLTPEQRVRFDELSAESTRESREARKRDVKTEIRAAGQTTGGEIIATKHTRDGYDLFVVKLAERVSKEDYATLLGSAKRMGGWYSAFRGNGAIPGFQFKDKANAEAFLKLAAGDTTEAQAKAAERRDAFEDDRSQSAVERLTEMADRLEERATEALNAERKVNTARRARFAASAEASANSDSALAKTMRNIAQAIADGKAKFLDAVRQKVQVEMLRGMVRTAKDAELRAKYPSYADQEKHRGEKPTDQTADFAEFPSYTAFRSDLASLARQMMEVDGTKKLGQQLMKVADDVTDAFTEFAKANSHKLMRFGTKDGGLAAFSTQDKAQAAIDRSGFKGKAIPFMVKRGEWTIITSPSEAINQGIWKGDGDKRITLSRDFGAELVQAIGRRGNKQNQLSVPWQFENANTRLKALSRIGIETSAEFRSALREFIRLQEQPAAPDKVKELERSMVGRRNDGMDFFPTPQSVADEMVQAAGIEPGMTVLEPSAGMGHIAERIRETGVEPDVVEMSNDRRELLEAKGFNLVGNDFMDLGAKSSNEKELNELLQEQQAIRSKQMERYRDGSATRARTTTSNANADKLQERIVWLREQIKSANRIQYDRIVMNPPFSDGRDIQHVQHAYTLLKPGGRLVAIMGESAFTNQNKRATEFREWLESVGGTEEKLPDGSFMDPSLPVNTGVNARMVVVDRGDGLRYSRTEYETQTTVTALNSAIKELTGLDGFNKLGKIVATTASEIKSTWEPLIGKSVNIESDGDAGKAQGFYDPKSKTVFLIADHIRAGDETAVLAHELMHKWGQQVLGKDGWDRLHSVIGTWANADKESDEYAVYNYAKNKVAAVGAELSNQELFPYAVEAAIKMGIQPSMTAARGTVARWLESVRQNLKVVWAKITGKPETFKAQDLVNLAFGIAQMENPEYSSVANDFANQRASSTIESAEVTNERATGNSEIDGRGQRNADQDMATSLSGKPAPRGWSGATRISREGRPITVYRGAEQSLSPEHFGKPSLGKASGNPSSGLGVWFTTGKGEAQTYGKASSYNLDIRNPKLIRADELPGFDSVDEAYAYRESLQKQGYDGIVISGRHLGKPELHIVAFEPNQVIEPNGGIQFSRAALVGRTNPHSWDAPEPSKFDDLVYKLQDKHIDTKRVIDAIRETAGTLADEQDVYLQEELFHGRAAARTEDFVNKELGPLVSEMKMRGIDIPTLDEYLHARHAEEANELIAQRNPDIQDGGSGMTTKAARDYLAKLDPAERNRLEAVAAKVDAILAATRQMYADYHLESDATVKGWGQMFKHYVPLMREDKDGGMGIGQGFSIKGKETKGRTGSTRKVVDILANIAMQRERAIVRGEKNRVSTALAGLVELNPNEDFWAVGPPPMEKVYDSKTDSVVERADPLYKSRENVIVAKIKQANGEVVEKAVRFNEDNERAMRMAAALKNLDAAQLEGVLGTSAKITRYFAAINTQYNPIFGAVNLVRDFQGALLNLSTTPLKNHKTEIAGHTLSALKGIYLDARAARDGKTPTSAWAGLWEEFQDEGGQTGYRDMFATSADRAKAIEHELNPTAWMDSPLGKVFTAGGSLKVPLAMAQKYATGLFSWLSDYNLAMENAVRLSAYKVGLEQGMSKQQAASLAKNLTVNFNRKGQVGQQAGAIYAFFNASMQGSARIGQTLFDMKGDDAKSIRLSATGKKIVYGGMLLGTMQALLLAASGFDDEEPPDFVRERSLVIPTGGKSYVTIPMPLGLHVIPNMGRIPTEFVLGGFRQPAKHIMKLIGLTAGAFNPVGGGASLVQMLSPTAVDPLVALAENKDWTGKPIAKTSYNKATPGHALVKDTASGPAKLLAEAINTMTGGTQYTAGVFSPTPDQIDYLWGQATGGVGREIGKAQQTASATISGEDLPVHKIPLVGRFYGNADTQSAQSSKFYATINRLNEHEAEIKGLRKDNKVVELADYIKSNPDARLFERANAAEREVQKLRRIKRELVALDAPPERIKAIETRITQLMASFNEQAARLKQAP